MPIEHVVVIFQENVSFDHYFATYPVAANTDGSPFYAADGTPTVNGLRAALVTKRSQFQQPGQQYCRQLRDQPVSPEPF